MRRFALLILVVAAAGGGYYYRSVSGPVPRYQKFAEEVLHRRYDAAAEMCDGLTAADLQSRGSQEQIGAGPQMFQTLFPSTFVVESNETSDDGKVTIHAVQTVWFNPAGVESAMRPAMFATLKQVVELRKGSGGWKVTAFQNTFDKMDTTSRR